MASTVDPSRQLLRSSPYPQYRKTVHYWRQKPVQAVFVYQILTGMITKMSVLRTNRKFGHQLKFIIHQDVLCKAVVDITRVLNVVPKPIDTIRSRGLVHRRFQEFLIEVDADYSDLLYHTKVRRLSCGYAFERV